MASLFTWIHNDYCIIVYDQRQERTLDSSKPTVLKIRTCSVQNIIFSQRENVYPHLESWFENWLQRLNAESRICLVELKLYGILEFERLWPYITNSMFPSASVINKCTVHVYNISSLVTRVLLSLLTTNII